MGMKDESTDFVFNMGFDYSHVTSVLTREGVEAGSRIYLLTPKQIEERQENSIRQLRSYLDNSTKDVELNRIEMRENFEENVLALSELLTDLDKVVLSLSGGPRNYLVPLVVSSVFRESGIERVYMKSDLDNSLDCINLPQYGENLSDRERKIIGFLENVKEANISKITEEVEIAQSTVSRIVKEMEEKGLVETERNKEGKVVSLTLKSRVLRL